MRAKKFYRLFVWVYYGFECNLEKNMHEFSKDYQNCTSPKDECNLKSLKNSRVYVFFQIARETKLLLINNMHEKITQLRA